MPKNAQITAQLHSFHMLPRLCSESFKPGFSNTWTKNIQMYKLDLEKAEEPEIKLPTYTRSLNKQREFFKNLLLLHSLCQSLWLHGSQQTGIFFFFFFWSILEEMGIPHHLICLLRNLHAGQEATVRTGHATGSKLGNEYIKAVHCHPAYLTYMQSIPYEMLGWKKHKLESRLPGEISITSDMQMISLQWQKAKRN